MSSTRCISTEHLQLPATAVRFCVFNQHSSCLLYALWTFIFRVLHFPILHFQCRQSCITLRPASLSAAVFDADRGRDRKWHGTGGTHQTGLERRYSAQGWPPTSIINDRQRPQVAFSVVLLCGCVTHGQRHHTGCMLAINHWHWPPASHAVQTTSRSHISTTSGMRDLPSFVRPPVAFKGTSVCGKK